MNIQERAEAVIGQKYNELTIIGFSGRSPWGHLKCVCKCDCGNIKKLIFTKVKKGRIASCGCKSGRNFKRDWEPIIDSNTVKIPLSKNKFATIDLETLPLVRSRTWSYDSLHGYAVSQLTAKNKTLISMHRLIMNPKPNQLVDHINRNPSDNRLCNLRLCSHQENLFNRGAQINNTSGHKGVCFDKRTKKWIAQIKAGKTIKSKRFKSKPSAIKQYNEWATELHGEFAHQNIMEKTNE